MFKKHEPAAGHQHTHYLKERGLRIRNGAENERGKRGIKGVVGKREFLGIALDKVVRRFSPCGLFEHFCRQFARHGERERRVECEVRTGAATELQNAAFPGKFCEGLASPALQKSLFQRREREVVECGKSIVNSGHHTYYNSR